MGEVDLGKAAVNRGYKYITLKRLVLLNARKWHRPFPAGAPATFSEDTGQASVVWKLEQGPFPPTRSFSLQGILEANFIKDQVAGPKQYK